MPGNVGVLVASRQRMDALESLYEEGSLDPLYDQIAELLGVRPRFHLDLTGTRIVDLVDLIGGAEVYIPTRWNPGSTAQRVRCQPERVRCRPDRCASMATRPRPT